MLHANTFITIPEAVVGRRQGTGVLLYVHEILPRDLTGRLAALATRAAADAVLTNSTASVDALKGTPASTRLWPRTDSIWDPSSVRPGTRTRDRWS